NTVVDSPTNRNGLRQNGSHQNLPRYKTCTSFKKGSQAPKDSQKRRQFCSHFVGSMISLKEATVSGEVIRNECSPNAKIHPIISARRIHGG
ncbi:hypothetical protein T310_9917, partial [Rasamsonia emersonii CBS 393.64]